MAYVNGFNFYHNKFLSQILITSRMWRETIALTVDNQVIQLDASLRFGEHITIINAAKTTTVLSRITPALAGPIRLDVSC